MIAFLFPGQGSQKVGMGKALAEAFGEARDTFDEADRAFGGPLSSLCFEGPEDRLMLMMRPLRCLIIGLITACAHSNAAVRLVESTWSQSSRFIRSSS